MAPVLESTPVTGSAEFHQLLNQLNGLLESYELILLMVCALEKHKLAQLADLPNASKEMLAIEALKSAQQNEKRMHAIVKQLDSAARQERLFVSSMPDEQLARLTELPALLFKRQGARLILAVVRDRREGVRHQGRQLMALFKQRVEQQAQLVEEADRLKARDLLERVQQYYDGLSANGLNVAQQQQHEDQRAKWIVELGMREQRIAQLQAHNETLQRQLEQLQQQLEAVESSPPSSAPAEKLVALQELVGQREQEYQQTRRNLQSLKRKWELVEKMVRSEVQALGELGTLTTTPTPYYLAPAKTVQRPVARQLEPSAEAASSYRVAVFVDVANIAGAARALFSAKVDYYAILQAATMGRVCTVARAYAIDKAKGFVDFRFALERMGYTVCAKQPRVFQDGKVKADWDVSIAVDALDLRDDFDICVLVSGDGDLVPVLESLKKYRKRIEVMSFQQHTSARLMSEADRYIELDDEHLIKSIRLDAFDES